MEPLDKCMSVLRVLITQAASNPNSVALAEKAVDEYMARFLTAQSKTGAIPLLQDALEPQLRAAKGTQLDFINLIYDYTDRKMRELRQS